MEVVIGTVAGVLAAIVCTAFYTKGLRDGAKVRGVKKRRMQKNEASDLDKELERRFDAILDYDPYGTDNAERAQGESA